jgi:metal-responsive CopG/Arc/MetJ family transcriptional regulator
VTLNEQSEFIEVELSDELSETFRLFCEAVGNAPRDEVIAAAIASYFRATEHAEGTVVPLRVV